MAQLVQQTPGQPSSGQIVAVPSAEVEWAPGSVPLDAPSYTRIVGRVRQASSGRGRPRELDRTNSGTGSVTVDNLDRAFDSLNAAGPWFGTVDPERQIRLGARYGGAYYPVCAGYIDGYPQTYDLANFDATTAINWTDAFKMLAQTPLPSSMYEMAVATDGPTHWWKLSETTTSVFTDSGNTAALYPLVDLSGLVSHGQTAVVPYGGGATSILFGGGQLNVRATIGYSDSGWSWECWFKMPSASLPADTLQHPIAYRRAVDISGTPESRVQIHMYGGTSANHGKIEVAHVREDTGATVTVLSPSTYNDGLAHHLAIIYSSTGVITLYIDGASVGSTVATTPFEFFSANGTYGTMALGAGYGSTLRWEGFLSHFSTWETGPLTAAQIANHYNAGANGFSGSTTGTQVSRVLDSIGYPSGAARSIQTGSSTIGAYDLPGGKVLDYLQTLADTEQGMFYVDRSGVLTWRQRNDMLTAARSTNSQATFGDSGIAYHTVTATTTNTSTVIANVSPVLTAADVGALVVGPGIPSGTTIVSQSGATATLSQAATLTQTGSTYNLGELAYRSVTPVYDETRLWNDVTVGRQGGEPQRVTDQASRRRYGPQGFPPKTSLLYATDSEALDIANWILTHNAYALQRVTAVSFDLKDAALIPRVLAREIGDRITIVRRPLHVGAADQQDLIIQGIKHTVTPGNWIVDFELSAAEAQSYWVLGDAILGVLGSTTRLAA